MALAFDNEKRPSKYDYLNHLKEDVLKREKFLASSDSIKKNINYINSKCTYFYKKSFSNKPLIHFVTL